MSLTQSVDRGTDLEGGTQFDVHGGDEMLLSQQQQSLPIDFLRQELSRQLFAAWTRRGGAGLQTEATEAAEPLTETLTYLEARR